MTQQISQNTLIPIGRVTSSLLVVGGSSYKIGEIRAEITANTLTRKIVDDQQKQIQETQKQIDLLKSSNEALGNNLKEMSDEMKTLKAWVKRCVELLEKVERRLDGK